MMELVVLYREFRSKMSWRKRKTWPALDTRNRVEEAHLKKSVQMATLGYAALRKKREDLLALQAKQKSVADDKLHVGAAAEEDAKSGSADNTKYPTQDVLQSHWEKLAAAILQDNTRRMTPVENAEQEVPATEMGYEQSGEGGLMPSRFYQLVTQLTTTKDVIARFKGMTPISPKKGEKRTLKYGQYRRDMAEQYDSYNSIKGCRYLRIRSSTGNAQGRENPFAIKEIFGERK